MDFYQGVVVDYLRANRSTFVNTEFCIQLEVNANPDKSGPHWYCDAVALQFQSKTVFLCEISFATGLRTLKKRLKAWHHNWPKLCAALARDIAFPFVDQGWTVRPWLFVPDESVERLEKALRMMDGGQKPKFTCRITPLGVVVPWKYPSWNRQEEARSAAASLHSGTPKPS